MALEFRVGPDTINSYRRLSYEPWYAIAEFVDNSTQNYFDNKDALDMAFAEEGDSLHVAITYDREAGYLRIADNAMGMSYEELKRALHVGLPPANATGRSRYGMGLKTASSWMGNRWKITTKKRGEQYEYQVTVDVRQIAAGEPGLDEHPSLKPADKHYTIIEIFEHNRSFQGRTLGKIANYLSSMYREDFRRGVLTLEWRGQMLTWTEHDDRLLRAKNGDIYKKEFAFQVDGKDIHGWVGILNSGSRSEAGFSILHSGRVIKGWPDSWRPSSLFGQIGGSNDLINQRLVGEIHLNDFDVSHTKDDILWLGSQEDDVEEALEKHCGDYAKIAKDYRKTADDERGPSDHETNAAIDELRRELESPEMVDSIEITEVPPPEIVQEAVRSVTDNVKGRTETFRAELPHVTVRGYVEPDLSPNDPYVVVDAAKEDEVLVIINIAHPHWKQIKGSDGILNYFRHCMYDGLAEWKARRKAAALSPDTIKLLKDRYLRVSFEIEMNERRPTDGDSSN
ncbi:MAG: ATP-binding protein [Gemmatimonadota bacterium]